MEQMLEFFECEYCHVLHLFKAEEVSKQDVCCGNCQKKSFQAVVDKFIIHCPLCFEYYPKRIMRIVHDNNSGILHCLNKSCNSPLKIRQKISSENVSAPLISSQTIKICPDGTKITGSGTSSSILSNVANLNPNHSSNPTSSASSPDDLEQIPSINFDIDFLHITPKNIVGDYDTFLHQLLYNIESDSLFSLKDSIAIFENALVMLDSISDVMIEEPVQYTYYIGEINGDFTRLQLIVSYFLPILNTYPSVKIIFLGNYLAPNQNNLFSLLLLSILYMVYPENVVLLRGKNDFIEGMEQSKIWAEILDYLEGAKDDQDSAKTIYRYIAQIFARLPFFHIGLMNQGQISIFSSTSGIPIDETNVDLGFNLRDRVNTFSMNALSCSELDLFSKHILFGNPDSNMTELVKFGSNSADIFFGQQAFTNFLKANSLHFMVRGQANNTACFSYCFQHNLCINIRSWGIDAKILRLVPNQSPAIIAIEKNSLSTDLNATFGLEYDQDSY